MKLIFATNNAHKLREVAQIVTTNDEDQEGRFFCGEYTFIESAPKVFFPAAGYQDYYGVNDYF
ncbi:MAG: hypothetical protein IJ952_04565, partial [Alistipes sp.]|nr:hypothetical protein [Alistipes sp.]